jgi:hypothetical protein
VILSPTHLQATNPIPMPFLGSSNLSRVQYGKLLVFLVGIRGRC